MKKINIRSSPITKQILNILGQTVGNAVNIMIELSPSRINRHLYDGVPLLSKISEQTYSDRKIKRALRELKQRNYIQIKEKGNKIFYCLTERGASEAFFNEIKKQNKKLTNNQICVICFDIPMAANDVRWALRRFLKTVGFVQLQKSVWYTKKDVFEHAQQYIKSLGAGSWIRVMRVSQID